MEGIPEHVLETLLSQMRADPQLPRPNPTTAFWQLPPHETLSQHQSPALPSGILDYIIIGSGVTGCSIANHLLSNPSLPKDARIAVLEARNLCSGATGRNGGALTSWVPYDFLGLISHFGEAEAIKIGRYAFRTLEKMHALGNSTPAFKEAGEVRRLRDVLGFVDASALEHAKLSFQKYEELMGPEYQLNAEFISAATALSKYNMKNIAGAMLVDCGAFWPYRLITAVWADLLSHHARQLTIETNTPATSITHDPSLNLYTITTPRGSLQTRTVIHATNGYTGHLLPSLRGKIHPLRGTMSTQKSTLSFGHHGSTRAWSIAHASIYDPHDGTFETGLYYGNQNPKTQDIFIGGEKVKLTECFVSDDTIVRDEARQNIEGILPRYFAQGWGENGTRVNPEVRKVWSGIMGFTSDGMPLVGRVPAGISGRGGVADTSSSQEPATRGGPGEYVAAGFNGYGMPQCWSVGEAVAKIVLGQYESDVKEWLPEVCLCTEARLAKMSAEASLAHVTHM